MYGSIQTFKLANYWLNSRFRVPGSRITLENFGVLGFGPHLEGLGSLVRLDHIGVPGLGSQLRDSLSRVPPRGSRSRVLGPTLLVCQYFKIATFFLAWYSSIQLNFFSGSSNLQDSYYWWSIFFLFCNRYLEKWQRVFFLFLC